MIVKFSKLSLLFLINFCLVYGMNLHSGFISYYDQIKNSIKECEKELPRHLSCDVEITAFVKEDSDK